MHNRISLPPDKDFLEEVIKECLKTFEPGYTISDIMIKECDLPQFKHRYQRFSSVAYKKTLDNHFIRDANRIPNSNFIASAGPDLEDMVPFLQDTVYHAHGPITHAVALGIPNEDFHDYFSKASETAYRRFLYHYSVQSTYTETNIENMYRSHLTIIDKTGFQPQRNLDLTHIQIPDGIALDIFNGDDEAKEAFYQLLQECKENPTIVHCASGVGRTGHFILTERILTNYLKIFSHTDPVKSAAMILAILDNMRSVRPALVQTVDQFTFAIRNADSLFRHALQKQYIVVADDKPKSPLSLHGYLARPVNSAMNNNENTENDKARSFKK